MRLINVHSLQFQEFPSGSVPRYAIASHRWIWGEEATFKDFSRGRNTGKSGHIKVLNFATYVRTKIHLDWVWADTVCIDSRSSQEVSEAVNRMFSFYRNAEICLAYLPDVHSRDEDAFVESEWFTRGWTLQELLAPRTVVFLNHDWNVVGHKGEDATNVEVGPTLDTAISIKTGIPEDILRNYELSSKMTVPQKLAWMSGRTTTREEDMYYSLYGLFNVSPGANYGEGAERARKRLLKEVEESSIHSERNIAVDTTAAPRLQQDPLVTQERLLESLYFPGFESRRSQVRVAYHNTYRWALLSGTLSDTRWSNLVLWLQDPTPNRNIYWISSKPGAGKSSLVRLLDEELDAHDHMQPWDDALRVVKLHFYFWNPGTDLQRSLCGLMRSLLYQLFQQLPEMLPKSVAERTWNIAQNDQTGQINWTEHDLRACLRTAFDLTASTTKLVLLIDGLDELDGDEDTRDELVDLIREFGRKPHIKLILSSRRWTIFQDAFGMCPQLHLEDLNSQDILTFVRGQFLSQYRYQQMLTYQSPLAERLVLDVVRKAEGVFLWARLVTKELVRSLRDGDSDEVLQQKLRNMPGDLSQYFSSLVDSIEGHHQREASIMLQLAMHREREFVTLSPLRLVDLIFIEHAGKDFALEDHVPNCFDTFNSAETLHYRLESTLRRLSSRCKGLLECYYRPGSSGYESDDSEDEGFSEMEDPGVPTTYSVNTLNTTSTGISTLPLTAGAWLFGNRKAMYDFDVDFMHRSLREYLQEPSTQQLLLSHTNGEFDARNYLRNARLAQVYMNFSGGLAAAHSLGLASYFISTLSIPSFRDTPQSVPFVHKLERVVPHLLQGINGGARYWYICRSLETWTDEGSNFITLAIDFALTGYLEQTLTKEMVMSKARRPLLDYVLRSRFGGAAEDHTMGNQHPIPELVQRTLQLGADPNQMNSGVSVWALFLNFCKLNFNFAAPGKTAGDYAASLETMIRAGASLRIKTFELSVSVDHGCSFNANWNWTANRSQPNDVQYGSGWDEVRFRKRWGTLGDVKSEGGVTAVMDVVPLTDVLESLRWGLGELTDRVKATAQEMEQRIMSID